jgi:hypothetical protein
MPIRVQTPNHGIVEFADGTDEATMTKALRTLDAPTEAPVAQPEERSLSGFAGNVLSSGGRFLADTAKGAVTLGKLAGGAFDPDLGRMAERGRQGIELAKNAPRILSAAGTALKNRYGGVEQVKNTLYTDPVGALADVSTLLDPAALGAKAGGLTRTAEGLSRAAELTNPMRMASKPVGEMLERSAPSLWDSAAKVPQGLKDRNPNMNIAQAGVKRGVLITNGGAKRNAAALSDLRKNKTALAATNTDPIDVSAIGEDLDKLKSEYAPGLYSAEDSRSVDRIGGRLLAKPTVQSGASGFVRTMPVKDAVQTVGAIDKKLRGKFGREGGPTVEAMKTVRHGLGAGVNETAPDIGKLNAEIGERAVLQRAVTRAVDRNAKTNFLNTMGTGIGAGVMAATGLTTGDPMLGAAAGIATRLADTPLVKSGAGVVLDRAGVAMQKEKALRAALLARLLGPPENP